MRGILTEFVTHQSNQRPNAARSATILQTKKWSHALLFPHFIYIGLHGAA
jgi:hypothetical protein